jgi:hypothetical protein
MCKSEYLFIYILLYYKDLQSISDIDIIDIE